MSKIINLDLLCGKTVKNIERVGHALVIEFDDGARLRISISRLDDDRKTPVLIPRAFEADIE